jgi:hypothetical protein
MIALIYTRHHAYYGYHIKTHEMIGTKNKMSSEFDSRKEMKVSPLHSVQNWPGESPSILLEK